MGKFNSSVLKECICRLEKVKSFSSCLLCLVGCWLQLRVSQNHLWNLEEYHLSSDSLNDAISRLQRGNKARINLRCFHKILRQIVQKIYHEVVTIYQVNKQVFWLGKEEILRVSHYHHLRLLQCWFQIVELNVIVVGQEGDLYSLARLSWQQLLLEHTLDCGTSVAQITTFYSWLWHVKCENVRRRHRWSIHILVICNKVDCTTVELGSLVMICSVPILLDRRVIVALSSINVSTEWTNPFLSILEPPYKRIDVCSAVLTPHNWILFEVHLWYFWNLAVLALIKRSRLIKQILNFLIIVECHMNNNTYRWKVSVWLYNDAERNSWGLACFTCRRNSVSGTSHEGLISVEQSIVNTWFLINYLWLLRGLLPERLLLLLLLPWWLLGHSSTRPWLHICVLILACILLLLTWLCIVVLVGSRLIWELYQIYR